MTPTILHDDLVATPPTVDDKSTDDASNQGDETKTSGSDKEDDDLEALRIDPVRRRLSPTGSMDDTYLRELLGSSLLDAALGPHGFVRRSQSCGVDQSPPVSSASTCRLRIRYYDETLRARCERNTHELLQTALNQTNTDGSTSVILARKALRYRRILERMEESNIDLQDPSFDASACLGVQWDHVDPE